MFRYAAKKRGFTLVELLVVVAIVALLAAVLVPRLMSYTERAREARAAEDIRTLRTIVEAYAADEGQGQYPINSNDPTVPNSIAAVMQKHGIKWTGDASGITDPWGKPYYYAQVMPNASTANLAGFVVISGGSDGQIGNEDDIYATNQSNVTSGKLSDGVIEIIKNTGVPSWRPGDSQAQVPQPASITLTANPQDAVVGTEVAVTAVVKDGAGQPVSGMAVHFETTLGTISSQDITTDQNGIAGTTLVSFQAGTATVTATAGRLTAQRDITFYANGPQPLRQPSSGEIPIYTPEELAKIGVDPNYPLDGKYILMANLDLSGYSNWVPIGNSDEPFTGTFDGNGLVIKHLTINRPTTNYQGLFGKTSGATLKNIGLEDVNVTGYYFTGGLVGYNDFSTITNSYSTGSVTGSDWGTGGLVGCNLYGTIENSYSTCSVTGSEWYTGGLVGLNSYGGAITNSYSTGSVIGGGCTGGLVGDNEGAIINCYSTGSVKGSSYYTGGLVGSNYGSITNSYSTGSIQGSYKGAGGLVGDNQSTITNSYWNTETSGKTYSPGGTGKTTAEMKQQATFTSWDFTTVWAIDEGKSYPYLRSNEQIPHPGANQ